MASMMNSSNDRGLELPPPDRGNEAVVEDHADGSTSAVALAGRGEFDVAETAEGYAPVSLADYDGPKETRVCDKFCDPRVLKMENEDDEFGDASGGENRPSSTASRMEEISRRADSRNAKLEDNKNREVVEDNSSTIPDYSSILSAFDEFAAKAKGEAVGHGYYIGDMVWGKVKSHPWWPGHIYNEALASPSVRRTKHEGQVLVAFFGDSSYGWFDPAELIPFEENFAEKSRQTMSRSFLKAVEESIDEVSRRRSLGLACRCRNQYNFWPSSVENYFVVDVGDYEPGIYGWSQINKDRDSFQPREMLSFVEQLALEPMNGQCCTIDFIKNKATVLACRRALFEEFDETYAQAFGTVPVRPPRPSAPVTVDPSKAPLTGRLVIAEALGQGKISVKPTKTKDQVEKDKYLFKRRDESIQMKSKKASLGQVGRTPHLHSIERDQMHQVSEPGIADGQHQPLGHQASMSSDNKPPEGFRKLVEGGIKKVKVQKRPAGELNAENAAPVEKKKKKKKKEIHNETGGNFQQLPVAVGNSGLKVENISGMPVHLPLIDNKLGNQKKEATVSYLPSQSQQAIDFGKVELQMLVTDLRALALNPFHGMERSCPAVIQQVFLKFRSLVYQKSLVLSLTAENEANEGNLSRLPTVSASPADKSIKKIVRPSVRLDDPTKGGKKRGRSDRPEDFKKKKKLDVLEEVRKMKKVDDAGDTKKKKIDDSKLLTAEKKILPKSVVSQRGDTKENAAKNASAALPKAVKLESGNRTEHTARVAKPTMLVMKFPSGAALPSGAQLRAKFARFGPLDHSGTRVFWKSYTCRLVYLYKVDAQAALKFAVGSSNLFGNTNVRCLIRELEVETAEPEPSKIRKEDMSVGTSQARDSTVEQRTVSKIAPQPLQYPQSAQQLKSCLKKPCGDEGGNGNGRGARVKFVLGGDESGKGGELLSKENKNKIASFPEGASSINSLDGNKFLPKFVPQTSSTLAPSTRFQNFPVNMPPPEQVPRLFNAPPTPINDISRPMLNLLMRCSDVVNNLTGILGYVPYHPL